MKVWSSTERGEDKIIAYNDKTLYKGNPSDADLQQALDDIKRGETPAKNFISIPVSYLRKITLENNKLYLQVFFGSSYEHFRIKDEVKRKDVFYFLEENIPGAKCINVKTSKLSAGKKPLIGMVILTIAFLWSLYYAVKMEAGHQYDVEGQHYNSIAGIILMLASVGVTKLVTGYVVILCIALYTLIRKIKSAGAVRMLVFS